MGLDIFMHIAKKSRKNKENKTSSELYTEIHEDANAKFTEWCDKTYKSLEEANAIDKETYKDTYLKDFAWELEKWFPNTDWQYKDMCQCHSLDEVKTWMDKTKGFYFHQYDAYFRKVNFIYAYFGNEIDENECCVVSKGQIRELRDTCEEVAKNHDLAEELLPTTSGFFFGSTEYDDYYFNDVEDCAMQMQKLLMRMDDDDEVLIHMSW